MKDLGGDALGMDDGRIIEEGERLSEELARQRQRRESRRWRCPVDLRSRFVAYAVACSADGESHRKIAEFLGVTQQTLSRRIAGVRRAGAGVWQVAIAPSAGGRTTPPRARAGLRLVAPFLGRGLQSC